MTLVEFMMEPFILMEKRRIPDGAGGFSGVEWVDGAPIDAACVQDTTMQARIAERQGVTSLYTVTTRKNVQLDYHDVIKRVRDGQIFRITGENTDKRSPAVSSLDIAQTTAEKWVLTT